MPSSSQPSRASFTVHAPVPPEHTAAGFLLQDKSDSWSWPKFVLGCILTLALNGGAIALLVNTDRDAELPVVVLLLLLGGGMISLIALVNRSLAVSRILPGQILLPRYPLKMGEEIPVTFRRQLRRNLRVQRSGSLHASLVCVERVRYRVGTDTRTETHTVWEQALPQSTVEAGSHQVEVHWQVKIPRQGPPSFEAPDNQIRWGLGVWLELPGLVKDDSNFALLVEPEVLDD